MNIDTKILKIFRTPYVWPSCYGFHVNIYVSGGCIMDRVQIRSGSFGMFSVSREYEYKAYDSNIYFSNNSYSAIYAKSVVSALIVNKY